MSWRRGSRSQKPTGSGNCTRNGKSKNENTYVNRIVEQSDDVTASQVGHTNVRFEESIGDLGGDIESQDVLTERDGRQLAGVCGMNDVLENGRSGVEYQD